jgi:hypothetical protein
VNGRQDEPVADTPQEHHHIGISQNQYEDIGMFLRTNAGDPAINVRAYFELKPYFPDFFLSRISYLSLNSIFLLVSRLSHRARITIPKLTAMLEMPRPALPRFCSSTTAFMDTALCVPTTQLTMFDDLKIF